MKAGGREKGKKMEGGKEEGGEEGGRGREKKRNFLCISAFLIYNTILNFNDKRWD